MPPARLPALVFRSCRADQEPAAALVRAQRQELLALYPSARLDDPDGGSDGQPPCPAFVVGFADALPTCCGGLGWLANGDITVCKMYVVPSARRLGVGRALLAELERRAVALGYQSVRIDTGPRQPAAKRLYEGAGYEECAGYDDPISDWFARKRLVG